MSITVSCECGKSYRTVDANAGKRGRCPGCGRVIVIPMPEVVDDPPAIETYETVAEPEEHYAPPAPRVVATAPAPPLASAGPGYKRYGNYIYLLLALTLLPLLVFTFRTEDDSIQLRLLRAIQQHPEIAQKLENMSDPTFDDVINLFPEHRIDGAFLARDTWAHWGLAILAAALFLGFLMAMFPGSTKARHLLLLGLFTGTIGIAFLLGVQYVAGWTQGMWLRGRGIVMLLFYIVKFIGFSYQAALDPENGFLLSFLGFTAGVGLCEELCKALPLLWHYRKYGTLSWRAAVVWGLASGIGFGVSEGITYSSDFYNGLFSGGIYVVRFVSCVGLHAIWAASVALMIHKFQVTLQDAEGWGGYTVAILIILAGPMVLHGLYDTLLKRDMNVLALLIALVSFGVLVVQVEMQRREDGDEETGEEMATA